ncbi:MAG: hypothetical protein HYS17_11795 [Micavibrio aeruginosavorus]|uniref:Uncharacterized protein n=1 Tax=Micavibrio aeruginosavorus TaxID=349221 RepID=A0A7T5UHZ5_9BACT|nr:MAG: hypothetical protein HYS17_11795 [Micavibrio aeruginosavorus]
MVDPEGNLAEMHKTIDDLFEACRGGASSPDLTSRVVGYLKQLQAERTPDGCVIMKTPVSADQDTVSAWAEIANRGLSYLGLNVGAQQVRRASSDVMQDIFQQATRSDLASMVAPQLSTHDHVQFTIRPADMEAFARALPGDHRRPMAESLLKALRPAAPSPAAAPAVVRHHSF